MNKQQLSTLAKDFANLPELSCLSFGWDKNAPSQFGNKVPKDALIDNIRSLLSDSTFENVFGRSAIGVSFLNDFLQNYSQIINDISSEDFESFYYASYIYSSLLLLSLSLSLQLKTGSSEALGDKIERIDRGSISRLLFRGQSDSSWGILPSMFRGVDYVGDIDYQWIVQRFQEHSLISEYRSFFKELDFSSNAE